MPGVFLSYRRADSAAACARLAKHLNLRFGDDLVFRDLDDLKPGTRWRPNLVRGLRAADVVLVLIGPKWLGPRQHARLLDPHDVVRQELVLSLSGRRRKVIPVLVQGAKMPHREMLPRPLRPLCEWEAYRLGDRRWPHDVKVLIERLRELVPALASGALDEAYVELERQQQRYFEILEAKPRAALALARKTLALLDRVCPRYPQDTDLQLIRGYSHKNVAMALLRLKRPDEARDATALAEQTFRTAIAERPRDASAWNGLGSVEAVKGHDTVALRHVNKALRLAPGYPAALEDKAALLARIRAR